MQAGKLTRAQMEEIFRQGLGACRDDVLAGPTVGVDCAVVSLGGGRCAVLKSDPITFATERVGWYAVHVNANDIATTGAEPSWFLSTILLPPGCRDEELRSVCSQIDAAAKALGVAVVGGHTEVTAAVSQVVVSGTMVGLVDEAALVHPRKIVTGDHLVITKGAAIEATAIIAHERAAELKRLHSAALQERAAAFLETPGLSVLPEARIFRDFEVHGMHDVTEGGLRAAAYEMALAAGRGLSLCEHLVPIDEVTKLVCQSFALDPLGAIGSGALLAAVPDEQLEAVLQALADASVGAAAIGRFLGRDEPIVVESAQGETSPLRYEPRDEITKIFE